MKPVWIVFIAFVVVAIVLLTVAIGLSAHQPAVAVPAFLGGCAIAGALVTALTQVP